MIINRPREIEERGETRKIIFPFQIRKGKIVLTQNYFTLASRDLVDMIVQDLGVSVKDAKTEAAVEKLIVPPTSARPSDRHQAPGAYPEPKRAKEIGDWAELFALKYIKEQLTYTELVHREAQGERPGWDIDYVDADGLKQLVEVKGAVGPGPFKKVENITFHEWEAACKHGRNYWLYIVAGCFSDSPKVQMIQDPASKASKDWTLTPTRYSLALRGGEEAGQ